jgi:hypothetical protein
MDHQEELPHQQQAKHIMSLLDLTMQKLCNREEIEIRRDMPVDLYPPTLLAKCLQQINVSSVFLPTSIADKLLKHLSSENKVTPHLLSLLLNAKRPIAHPSILPLGGSTVTSADLERFGGLSGVTEIDLSFTNAIGNSWYHLLLGCKDTIRTLKMCYAGGVYDLARIAEFPGLVHLDLSFTSLGTDEALLICMALTDLQHLDISGTNVNLYGVLPQLKHLSQLQYLAVHSLVIPPPPEISTEVPLSSTEILDRVGTCFSSLTKLRHLDISWMKFQNSHDGWLIDPKEFLHSVLQGLRSLRSLEAAKLLKLPLKEVVQELKDNGLYNHMEFIGFADDYRVMGDSDIAGKVSNDIHLVLLDSKVAHKIMIPEYLRRPMTTMPAIVNVFPSISHVRPKLVELVSYVLQALRLYGDKVDVMVDILKPIPQASADLVLSSIALAENVIIPFIEILLALSIRHPEVHFLPRYLYLLLNMQTHRIVGKKELLSRLMAFIVQSSDNTRLENTVQVSLLVQSYEVVNMLLYHLTEDQRVWLACDMGLIDSCLRLARRWYEKGNFQKSAVLGLGAVWNICDDLPQNCCRVLNFPDFNAVDFLVDFGDKFSRKEDAVTSVIGPLGNIAEVPDLRVHLRKPKLLNFLAKVLTIESMGDVICLTTSRLICNLSMDESAVWPVEGIQRKELLGRMYSSMKLLPLQPNMPRLISYRSLIPLVDLLRCSHSPEVMYFGLWRLASLCIEQPEYAHMLRSEGGLEVVARLTAPSGFEEDFQSLSHKIQEECAKVKEKPPMPQMPPGIPPIPGLIPPPFIAGGLGGHGHGHGHGHVHGHGHGHGHEFMDFHAHGMD